MCRQCACSLFHQLANIILEVFDIAFVFVANGFESLMLRIIKLIFSWSLSISWTFGRQTCGKKRGNFVIHFFFYLAHFFLQLDMSWGGFKKAINRAGASVIVKDVDKTMDKDFDVEERRYKTLKTAGTNYRKLPRVFGQHQSNHEFPSHNCRDYL